MSTSASSGSSGPLPSSARRIAAVLAELGHDHDVVVLDDSARTADEAASALGCTAAEIAKSIVFRRTDDAAVVVVTSGDRRVDVAKVAALVGPVRQADADFVRSATGFAIGGVPPVGHDESTLVLVDGSLGRFERVWAAAGHPHAVFPVSPCDLVAWLGGRSVDTSP